MAGNPRPPSVITLRTGLTQDGRIVARRVTAVYNGGAYAAFKPTPSVNLLGAGMGGGVYRIPHLLIESLCVYTNNVPCGHVRAPGEPQMVFAEESHMDMIAGGLGLDPAELRRRNLLKDGDLLPNGHPVRHVRASETLEGALKAGNWRSPKPGLWIGRGLSMCHRHIGTGFANARARLETDGRVTLVTTFPDTGTGAHTVLRQVVAEVLGLPIDTVEIEMGSTDSFDTESGVGGSRVTHVGGQAAYHAALQLKERILAGGASLLSAEPGQLELRDGQVGVGRRSASLGAVAQQAGMGGRPPDAPDFYDAE